MNALGKKLLFVLVLSTGFHIVKPEADTLEYEACETMKKAAGYYFREVSTKGGYLFEYTVDMKHRYGEMPARDSQIWVQDPATPGVGQVYLDAYEATGESLFLEAADAAARALIRGQLECGGWNYIIDFKPGSIDDWYANEGNHPDFQRVFTLRRERYLR